MRWMIPLGVLILAVPAQAKWSLSVDSGAAIVMPTGLEGESETVGPNLGVNLGYQMGNSLRLDLGAVLIKSRQRVKQLTVIDDGMSVKKTWLVNSCDIQKIAFFLIGA